MARVVLRCHFLDERGAVYVEFLIVFMPFFLLFLGICQIAMVAAARFVVQHSASSAARSAVVVLESDPNDFGGVERGVISRGSARASGLQEALLQSLGIQATGVDSVANEAAVASAAVKPQQGARMAPIRFAAYVPLAVLAPLSSWLSPKSEEGSLGDAIAASTRARLGSAVVYSRAATVVTIRKEPGSNELALEPIGRKAPVTVRVTYLYYCSIPVVRVIGCKTLKDLLGTAPGNLLGLQWLVPSHDARSATQRQLGAIVALAEDPASLIRLDASGARFAVLTGEATLPNQGANYY